MIKALITWVIIASLIRLAMEIAPNLTARKTLTSIAIATFATLILSTIVLLF